MTGALEIIVPEQYRHPRYAKHYINIGTDLEELIIYVDHAGKTHKVYDMSRVSGIQTLLSRNGQVLGNSSWADRIWYSNLFIYDKHGKEVSIDCLPFESSGVNENNLFDILESLENGSDVTLQSMISYRQQWLAEIFDAVLEDVEPIDYQW
jgi:hypothetical protein